MTDLAEFDRHRYVSLATFRGSGAEVRTPVWFAALLFLWMMLATLYFNAFWTYPLEQAFNQTNHFLKNLALTGTLLFIVGMGSGPVSLGRGRSERQA